MGLTPAGRALRRERAHAPTPTGACSGGNHLFAKISRPEVARRFLAPAPPEMLDALVAAGQLTRGGGRPRAARAAGRGRHRRGRLRRPHRQPAAGRALPDASPALRDELAAAHGYAPPIRVGAAGGLGTPARGGRGVRAGRRLRADRLGEPGRRRVGPLGRGQALLAAGRHRRRDHGAGRRHVRAGRQGAGAAARHAVRAARAAAATSSTSRHASLEAIPAGERDAAREGDLPAPLDDGLASRRERFCAARDPRQIERAERATRSTAWRWCFRWYLGQSSRWAIAGDADAPGRLPDLVRPGDGRVQRLGARLVPRASPRSAPSSRSRATCSRAPPS